MAAILGDQVLRRLALVFLLHRPWHELLFLLLILFLRLLHFLVGRVLLEGEFDSLELGEWLLLLLLLHFLQVSLFLPQQVYPVILSNLLTIMGGGSKFL